MYTFRRIAFLICGMDKFRRTVFLIGGMMMLFYLAALLPKPVHYYLLRDEILSEISQMEHVGKVSEEYECVPGSLPIKYDICVYKKKDYISDAIKGGGEWEKPKSITLGWVMKVFKGAVFMDIGSNIGAHSLYVASTGLAKRVWAIDAVAANCELLKRSSEINKFQDRIRHKNDALSMILNGGISDVRTEFTFLKDEGNVGGTRLVKDGGTGSLIKAFTFSDYFNYINEEEGSPANMTLVLKLDIESMECRAILGSKELFMRNNLYIPFIILEWNFPFMAKTECPIWKEKQLKQFLVDRGYTPYRFNDFVKMDPSESWNGKIYEAMWIHNKVTELQFAQIRGQKI